MDNLHTRERFTAIAVFVKSPMRSPWRLFTRRGYDHCFVLLPTFWPEPSLMADRGTMIVNFLSWRLSVSHFSRDPETMAQEMLKAGATAAISIPVDHVCRVDYIPRGVMTCVSVSKAILGVNDWMVVTPEQFARSLLLRGGKLLSKGSGE